MRDMDAGIRRALRELGLTKTANSPLYEGPDGQRMPFWASVRANTYRQLLGKPRTYLDEVRSGKWRDVGSYTRTSLWPSGPTDPTAGPLRRGLSHALPALYYLPSALSLYGATQAPAEAKGEAYGAALGTLLGSIGGAPLGLLGSSAGSLLGSSLGQSVGRYLQHGSAEPSYYDASAQGPA